MVKHFVQMPHRRKPAAVTPPYDARQDAEFMAWLDRELIMLLGHDPLQTNAEQREQLAAFLPTSHQEN
jgi:hypothetical protein